MGTPLAAVPTLQRIVEDGHEVAAVYTQPDRPSGRGNKVSFSPVKDFAIGHGLEVRQPLKIRTPEAIEAFRSTGADAAVVVAYGRILPADYLSAFPMGAINVHFSLLPKYRGAAPVNWAVAHGETKTGVTTMKMDEGLDTGDILLQSSTAINPEETAVELTQRLAMMGADLLAETLSQIAAITPTPQDNGSASFAPILKKEDGRIDWELPAREIADRVRGFQPFPTAFTSLGGAKLTIWKAHADDNIENTAPAGTIIPSEKGRRLVSCGSGTVLSIEELQLEGKRRLATRDFLNGINLREGDKLG